MEDIELDILFDKFSKIDNKNKNRTNSNSKIKFNLTRNSLSKNKRKIIFSTINFPIKIKK